MQFKNTGKRDFWIILALFLVSRIIVRQAGLYFGYSDLYIYWQYLDVETLRHNLLNGVWYDHAQPPLFNILLGTVLKTTGSYAPVVFENLIRVVTLINVWLLYSITRRLTQHAFLPLIVALIYLLSPATLLFESELFYTTFNSMLLLLPVYFIIRTGIQLNWRNAILVILPLLLICLTRSMYHLLWLLLCVLLFLFFYRKKEGRKKLLVAGVMAVLIVGGWYYKNYRLFGNFSSSTWLGMNVARNIFHEAALQDSSNIGAIEPFHRIGVYQPYITHQLEKKYAGLDDRDLLKEYKNDTIINGFPNTNMNHISYIEVSQKYMEASKEYVKKHPGAYVKNIAQSAIVFFSPATRYPVMTNKLETIKYYDLIYSFNLAHLAKNKQQKDILIVASAIPKFLFYAITFLLFFRAAWKRKQMSAVNGYIALTVLFIFSTGSILEHYETMRFRYEVEPLFLILAAQVWLMVFRKKGKLEKEIIAV